jgi:hypothetical protein
MNYVVWLKFSKGTAHKLGELPNVWVEQGDGLMGIKTAERIAGEISRSFPGIQAAVLPLHTYPMILCIGENLAQPVATLDRASKAWLAHLEAHAMLEARTALVRDAKTREPLAVITEDGRCWTPGSNHKEELPLAGVPTLASEQAALAEKQQCKNWEAA